MVFKKNAAINPQNTKDNYCFMYGATIALNHQEIGANNREYQQN